MSYLEGDGLRLPLEANAGDGEQRVQVSTGHRLPSDWPCHRRSRSVRPVRAAFSSGLRRPFAFHLCFDSTSVTSTRPDVSGAPLTNRIQPVLVLCANYCRASSNRSGWYAEHVRRYGETLLRSSFDCVDSFRFLVVFFSIASSAPKVSAGVGQGQPFSS